jgi:hypothetical protein
MKATIVAAAAAVLAGGVSAGSHNHHRAHQDLFQRRGNDSGICTPGCTTIYTTITGPAGRMCNPSRAEVPGAMPDDEKHA